jgi:hypothetical protein
MVRVFHVTESLCKDPYFRKVFSAEERMNILRRANIGLLTIALFLASAFSAQTQEAPSLTFGDMDVRAQTSVSQKHSRAEFQKELRVAAADTGKSDKSRKSDPGGDQEWRGAELNLLGIGLGVGDLDGDGQNEIVIIDPNTVYAYKVVGEKFNLLAEYSPGALELKSVDVAKTRPQGPSRIYVSAQNRGAVASFVLELRAGKLVPVIREVPYFLRVIDYPTRGPILIGQKKGMRNMYDGYVYRLVDKGDDLEPQGRFGVPLKIPVFGFAIGDFEGKRKPLIAVYDRHDHLRIYEPSGKRLFVSKDYYGESDVLLRRSGPENRRTEATKETEEKDEFFRPRILSLDLYPNSIHQILVIAHSSRTRRLLSHSKMLEEGQIMALGWNGDALEEQWTTPKVQGVITDFALAALPGLSGTRLIVLERKRTDWLALLKSRSQVRAYDLKYLMKERSERGRPKED